MGRNYKTEAIILKRKNFGEADKILTLFTKYYGKIDCLAKGVRKIDSKRAPSLEIFNYVKVSLTKGKTWDILTEVELLASFPSLRGSLSKIRAAFALCELVDNLTAWEQKNQEVFLLLKESINSLASFPNEESIQGLVEFKMRILQILGFGFPPEAKKKFLLDEKDFILNAYIEKIIEKKLLSDSFLKI